MLVVPSLQSFQIRLSQLPLDGVSYSLTSVTDGIAVDLGDAAVQQVSPVVHTFIRTYMMLATVSLCAYIHVWTLLRMYALYIRMYIH